MSRLYYTPPTDDIFNEVRNCAIQIWRGYDDTYNYATEKISRIEDIGNVGDNLMYIVAMFDMPNQTKLGAMLSEDARDAIFRRMLDGGNDMRYIAPTLLPSSAYGEDN